MDIAGTDGGVNVSKGVKRQASEAPEVDGKKLLRRPKMTYATGKTEQDKKDRRKKLIVKMNRVFLEWVRFFREENGSAEKRSPEAATLKSISTSKSFSTVFAPSVKPQMAKMEEHREFFEEFFEVFKSKSNCDRAGKEVIWEKPTK